MELVKAHLAAMRLAGSFDVDLERELDELIAMHDWQAEELARVEHHLDTFQINELLGDTPGMDTAPRVANALRLLHRVRDVLDTRQIVAIFEVPEAVDQLAAYVDRLDALDAFRSLVLGKVKKRGAIAMDKQPDDKRLLATIEALFP